jgi:hypothetical protein
VHEISSAEYAIDGNLSRLEWMPINWNVRLNYTTQLFKTDQT